MKLINKEMNENFTVDIEVEGSHTYQLDNGIVTHNSDCNRVSAITQIKVLEMIMAGKPENDVIAYIRYNHTKMKDRKYTDEEIGFPKGITKELDSYYPPGPIIKGSVYSNKHFNTRFGKGSKPKFVWIKTVKELPETVTMNMVNKQGNRIVKDYKIESAVFDKKIPDNFVIDWDKMSDLTFKSKLINILNAVGWDWQDLNTINLKNFMR